MPMTVALYKKLEEVEPQLRGVLFAILEEIERQREETVTKVEFNELTEIVRDLAEAQKQTEKRITELAEAQKQTENRLGRLEAVVGELAEAQKQTEKRVNELAEVQKQTMNRLDRIETAVGQLTEAIRELVKEHKELVTAHRELVKEHSITRTIVNGLSTTTGFVLEDKAYEFLPALLKRDFGLEVQGELTRNFAKDKTGEQIEVNILGEAIRNGDRFVIVGECKAQLSKNKVDEFFRKKLKRLEGVYQAELFPILVTHMISQPEVAELALQQGIKRVYYSYEFRHKPI